jgi:hypothetical protein
MHHDRGRHQTRHYKQRTLVGALPWKKKKGLAQPSLADSNFFVTKTRVVDSNVETLTRFRQAALEKEARAVQITPESNGLDRNSFFFFSWARRSGSRKNHKRSGQMMHDGDAETSRADRVKGVWSVRCLFGTAPASKKSM